MAYDTVTLTGRYLHFDGVTPARGVIEIIPSVPVVIDAEGDAILSGRIKVALDEAGEFSVDLPATDDEALNPSGFGYTVAAKLSHKHLAAVSFALPAAVPVVDMADVVTVDPATFEPGATYAHASELAAETAARTAADALLVPLAQKGAASGVAPLDSGSRVAEANLPANLAAAALSATYASLADDAKNIVKHGVTRGTAATQTAAIKAALDAYPGEAFYFPPGDYRLDTSLSITANNSLVLAPGARIYAGAAMDTLIDYDNGLGSSSDWSADKCIVGNGRIDGALLANKALAIGSVIRISVAGITITNPVNRGIYLKSAGAEVIIRDLNIRNTTTSNASDNIGIESDMSDCFISDVIIRDFTIGVWDKGGSNIWTNLHPWIGNTAQLTARYPSSVAFKIARSAKLIAPHADTYRYGFQGAATTGFASAVIVAPRFFCNTGNLTDGLAAASPGAVFDLTTADEFTVTGGEYRGHAVTPYVFVQGTSTRFTARNSSAPVGGISGRADYHRGVKITNTDGGPTSFSPTVYGHTTAGTTTYSTQSGSLEVRDGIVWYRFRVTGSFGSGAVGNVRIGGFPFPPGATSVSTGHGPLTRSVGAGSAVGLAGVNGTSGPTVAIPQTISGAEVAVTASGAFDLWGEIAAPFTYPS